MKRVLAVLLVCVLVIAGCNQQVEVVRTDNDLSKIEKAEEQSEPIATSDEKIKNVKDIRTLDNYVSSVPDFAGMNDEGLLRYVQDNMYAEIVKSLNGEEYLIEDIEVMYISKEFLEEMAYNSEENIFFGYTLEEIEDSFGDQKYVFSLGEDGTTTVKAFDDYDDTYEKVIKDVAIGSGVILVSITVSFVSASLSAPAMSVIFAASAKSGSIMALTTGTLSGVAAGVTKGIETGDFDQALKSAALVGGESFKWGAVSGTLLGGASKALALKSVTQNGLTMKEAVLIQKESGYPLDVIRQFKSMKEYRVYKEAGLQTKMVGGRLALVREIDLAYTSKSVDGKLLTNLERMKKGLAPIDPDTGLPYQLHHINQEVNATLAVLKSAEHQGNASILNTQGKEGVQRILGASWDKQRKQFWEAFALGIEGVG